MKLNHIQLASVLMLGALFTVPSLAFPSGIESSCYQADLLNGDLVVGKVKFTVSDQNECFLEVETEEFMQEGVYEVRLFKDYYSDFVAGSIEVDSNGDGEELFQVPYQNPDFTVLVEGNGITLSSGDWVACEKPGKPVDAKISPSTLNLKSNGKWVTVKILYPVGDSEPSDFRLHVDGDYIEPTSVKVSPKHITLKFSRAELQKLCEPGDNTLSVSFSLGNQSVELSDTIKVINNGKNQEQASPKSNNGKSKPKSNNGKPKNKTNNGKAIGKNK